MLGRIFGVFIPKVGELLVDYVQEKTKDFKFTLDSLERNLKSLSARASDVEEQIKNVELSGKKKRKREVENWLIEVKSIETKFVELENEVESEGFIRRFMVGGQVAELNAKVDYLVQQSQHFGELLVDVYETRAEAFLTTTLIGTAFEENLERIWRLLVIDKVTSIGIHGMGGVGKTTLTKHIHNRLLEKTQERVIWVAVSQVFTIKKLQDEIASLVDVDLSDEHDEDKRAARLYRSLSHRKNVLILDDVWENLNLEKVGYPISIEGFRLIITTRSLKVCHQIVCQEVITVKTLLIDEAWCLFNETLGKETKLAPQVQEIAKVVAKLCDGLPLGIITLAGSMRGETNIYVWRNALEELKQMRQDDMEDKVFKVLKYSFDRLNPDHQRDGQSNWYNPLQLCFLYCSLYPEDWDIQKEELIRKFIIEELMDKRKSRKAQIDQGYSILDKLMNVCLLESTVKDGDYCVKMHDLVRTMALKITEGKTMVISGHRSLKEIPGEEEWTKDLEKVSLMWNDITKIQPGMSPNCPKLSTLLLQRNMYLKSLPDSLFSQMHGLHSLDLSETGIKELPNSLSDLVSLKALLLRKCEKLEYVPYLGKLKALRELDLSGTAIKEVPQGIEELVNLKFLAIVAHKLVMLPTGLLLKFPDLQCLETPYQIEVPVEEIEKLRQLEEYNGRMKNVRDFNRFIRSGQSRVYGTSYAIHVGSAFPRIRTDYSPIHRKKVYLYECNLKNGEEEDEIMLEQDIQYLELMNCMGLSSCLFKDLISNLRSLETLKLFHCDGLECILTSEQLMAVEELQSQFSTLEEIFLVGLRDFKGVIDKREIGATVLESPPPRQAVVFSSLRLLVISDCEKMKKLGLSASEFPNLEEIHVEWCEEIEEIIADEEGRGEGEACIVRLPKLKELHLYKLPRMRSICKATMICTSIERIRVVGCPRLKELPFDDVPPPVLKDIRIR